MQFISLSSLAFLALVGVSTAQKSSEVGMVCPNLYGTSNPSKTDPNGWWITETSMCEAIGGTLYANDIILYRDTRSLLEEILTKCKANDWESFDGMLNMTLPDANAIEALRIYGDATVGIGTMPKLIDGLIKETKLGWIFVDANDQTIPWFWRSWYRHAHKAATTNDRRGDVPLCVIPSCVAVLRVGRLGRGGLAPLETRSARRMRLRPDGFPWRTCSTWWCCLRLGSWQGSGPTVLLITERMRPKQASR
ncbi:hypothetical protein PG984_004558 [Apiospora sp. TS-2023a]